MENHILKFRMGGDGDDGSWGIYFLIDWQLEYANIVSAPREISYADLIFNPELMKFNK